MKPAKEKPLWANPKRTSQEHRQHAVARLHGIRLQRLSDIYGDSLEYDAASTAVLRLGDGSPLYDLVMQSTACWPWEK